MKKILLTCIIAGCYSLVSVTLTAQDTTTAAQDIKKAAKKQEKPLKKAPQKLVIKLQK